MVMLQVMILECLPSPNNPSDNLEGGAALTPDPSELVAIVEPQSQASIDHEPISNNTPNPEPEEDEA